jgi:hypothetical protein
VQAFNIREHPVSSPVSVANSQERLKQWHAEYVSGEVRRSYDPAGPVSPPNI